jgi:hypothetical protein
MNFCWLIILFELNFKISSDHVTDHYEEVTCDCLACHILRTENEERNNVSQNSKSADQERKVSQITKTENENVERNKISQMPKITNEERNNASRIPKFENKETNSNGENDDTDSNYNYSYDDVVVIDKTKWKAEHSGDENKQEHTLQMITNILNSFAKEIL